MVHRNDAANGGDDAGRSVGALRPGVEGREKER
jgi:hypothetical protein